MRLKSIKLAGFKSFVDPTTVQFPSNLTAVVGPNGCGKSNIIDAVRWVMGESSAKTLRGASMTDVIFSGSTTRMPIGQASIELIFDNTEGSLGGEYGAFNEIAVRRLVTRDLQSSYFLNGSKCRRRDIQDIFLGTGMGPRSYSIIEQGTISRFIEAKPDELRHFIEEAAGISKYRERRRDTENRIRRTRENLDRLTDIRDELGRQLSHLQHQAKAAEQYSALKKQQRTAKAELLAIRWRALDETASAHQQQLGEQMLQLEAIYSEQRRLEADIEQHRVQLGDANDHYQQVQAVFYQLGTDIARQQQAIEYQQQRARTLGEELLRAENIKAKTQLDLQADQQQADQLSIELAELEPEMELLAEQDLASNEQLEQAEEMMQEWQQRWDDFNQRAAEPRQRAQVEQSRIQHAEQTITSMQKKITRLEAERVSLADNPDDNHMLALQAEHAQLEELAGQHEIHLAEMVEQIAQQRETNQCSSKHLDQARRTSQELQGRHGSLTALQQAALGKTDVPVGRWLEQHQLHRLPRLAQNIRVEKGWERAVEAVLDHHLQGVCLPQWGNLADSLARLEQGAVTLLGPDHSQVADAAAGQTTLLSKISSTWNLNALVAGIYVAENIADALSLREQLSAHESVVCKDGLWLGCSWIRVRREIDEQASVLEGQQQLQQLDQQIAGLDEIIANHSLALDAGLLTLREFEQDREQAQQALNDVLRQCADIAAQISAGLARIEQFRMRHQRLLTDLDDYQQQMRQQQAQLAESRQLWQQYLSEMEQDEDRKEALMGQRDSSRTLLDDVRQRARHNKDLAHQAALSHQLLSTRLAALSSGLERLAAQLIELTERATALREEHEESALPTEELQQSLAIALEKRLLQETRLSEARLRVEKFTADLAEFERQRQGCEQRLEKQRALLEANNVQAQGLQVQRDNLEDQLRELKQDLQDVLARLPDDAHEADWNGTLEHLHNRIQRLGAINLAAIDEYKTQSERKTYLDSQHDDLVEALDTLENAIRKIDRETRVKFKDTFDKINQGLQQLFPKVFGGGQAYLELTGDDLLETGVTIMARPPGKRNNTIHLLSGGEKALTAISLVFAIFKLNPAPFCMLDEVDAPLDDANVGRFCRIVKEMSETVQFIYITHNKVTMEMATHMMGVTMLEPGVSRLVSVNVDQAVALVAV